jgi:hypothetical protein
MDQLEFFKKVIGILQGSGFGYMVVGSFASGFWGEPRATYDVDVVIAITERDVPSLAKLFSSDEFYYSADAAREAIRLGKQFNVIHADSGNKIDLMVRRDDVWGREHFSRRRSLMVAPGFKAVIAAPEDVILGKLQYYQEGGSEKHLRDIAGIVKMRGNELDLAYIDTWSARLGIFEEWNMARRTK